MPPLMGLKTYLESVLYKDVAPDGAAFKFRKSYQRIFEGLITSAL